MTQQESFGGFWTQQKLEVLTKYLRAYRQIFESNQRAKFFQITYVDAFAGTGVIPRRRLGPIAEMIPELATMEEEFRKGSVVRALGVKPPFHHYSFIEKNAAKCDELRALRSKFPNQDIQVVNKDANVALLEWCRKMNTRRERAVVFLDPFGASVDWNVIEAIATTKAIDLWVLFPYGAIDRMLTSGHKPPKAWADRISRSLGTREWEREFYSSEWLPSLFGHGPDTSDGLEVARKMAGEAKVTQFVIRRLKSIFVEVAEPGFLRNTKGRLLFLLLFAAGNIKGAKPGVKIANDLLRGLI